MSNTRASTKGYRGARAGQRHGQEDSRPSEASQTYTSCWECTPNNLSFLCASIYRSYLYMCISVFKYCSETEGFPCLVHVRARFAAQKLILQFLRCAPTKIALLILAVPETWQHSLDHFLILGGQLLSGPKCRSPHQGPSAGRG